MLSLELIKKVFHLIPVSHLKSLHVYLSRRLRHRHLKKPLFVGCQTNSIDEDPGLLSIPASVYSLITCNKERHILVAGIDRFETPKSETDFSGIGDPANTGGLLSIEHTLLLRTTPIQD